MSIRALLMLAVLVRGAAAGTFVHWQAPETCPEDAVVDERVASRLGSDARADAPIEVTVHRESTGFVADIAGSRTLTSASCSELADAVALVVARLVLDQPPPAPAPVPAPTPAPTPAPPPPPPAVVHVSVVPASTEHEPFAAVRLSEVSGVGAQPGLSLGGELTVHVRTHGLFVELGGALWSGTATSGAMGGMVASLREGVLRTGWLAPHHMRVWLAGELGSLRGEGMMVVGARVGSAAWAGLGAGGAVSVPLAHHVSLVGALEVVAALTRPKFGLEDGEMVYQPEAVAARLSVGLEIDWP